MFPEKKTNPVKACLMLLLATVFWGSSFVVMKALGQHQEQILPGVSSWFVSSTSMVVRFGLAAVVLVLWNFRSLGRITRSEIRQGAGLGFFGGVGIFFQMDGVMHTAASTSAFLTQCYCIFIPIFVAWRKRAWPAKLVALSCIMVLAGVGVLSEFNWHELRMGRGEWEAVLASVFFTAQILWLERPTFSANKSSHTSLVMFAAIALPLLPVALLKAGGAREILVAYQTPTALISIASLTIFCTLMSYGLMNFWQPQISATSAGLIYCSEPLFTSLFALFLPGIFSTLAEIHYANELVTPRLLLGGGLITAANILIIVQAALAKPALICVPERKTFAPAKATVVN